MIDATAVIRLKNEVEWLPASLYSIRNIFSEILLCTQGDINDDGTYDLCENYAKNNNRIKHFHYEYDSRPNGPGHSNQPLDKHSRPVFYNWCFEKASNKWVCKWDGDMLAFNDCEREFENAFAKNYSLKFKGIDLVNSLYYSNKIQPYCASEIRLYNEGYYELGKYSERLKHIGPEKTVEIDRPLFLHTKWFKDMQSSTKAWPKNWYDVFHFKRIYNIKKECIPIKHKYDIPQWIIDYKEKNILPYA